MVRLKTRWLLVRIELPTDNDEPLSMRNVVLARGIRDHLLQCFGDAAAGAAYDTHVRWCDSGTQLALIRVPREFYPMIRASVTLLTQLVVSANHTANKPNDTTTPTTMTRLALHVLSVHGSARTAKLQALRRVQKLYRDRIVRVTQRLDDNDDKRPTNANVRRSRKRPTSSVDHDDETIKLCRVMQETLEQIAAIEF